MDRIRALIKRVQILTSLNKPDHFIVAIGLIDGESDSVDLRYVRRPFTRKSVFGVTSGITSLPPCWPNPRIRHEQETQESSLQNDSRAFGDGTHDEARLRGGAEPD